MEKNNSRWHGTIEGEGSGGPVWFQGYIVKFVTVTTTVEAALDGAVDIRTLAEEMESWQESLESASMEHTPKYDEVTEAVTFLTEAIDEIENAVEAIRENEDFLDTQVSYVEISPYGRRVAPRWMQLGNAVSMLRAVAEAMDDGDELESSLEDLDSVDFPSMY